jgi:hypothetical protein
LGYVTAVSDAIGWYATKPVCPGGKLDNGQVRDIVIKYLREHPERRQYSAVSLATDAIQQAFPCTK